MIFSNVHYLLEYDIDRWQQEVHKTFDFLHLHLEELQATLHLQDRNPYHPVFDSFRTASRREI